MQAKTRRAFEQHIQEHKCGGCPYEFSTGLCVDEFMEDLQLYIQRLEKENYALREALRDYMDCTYCKHHGKCAKPGTWCIECNNADCICNGCNFYSKWEWRGLEGDDK